MKHVVCVLGVALIVAASIAKFKKEPDDEPKTQS